MINIEAANRFIALIKNKGIKEAKKVLDQNLSNMDAEEIEMAKNLIESHSNTGDNPMPYNKKGKIKLKGYKTGKKGGLLYRNIGSSSLDALGQIQAATPTMPKWGGFTGSTGGLGGQSSISTTPSWWVNRAPQGGQQMSSPVGHLWGDNNLGSSVGWAGVGPTDATKLSQISGVNSADLAKDNNLGSSDGLLLSEAAGITGSNWFDPQKALWEGHIGDSGGNHIAGQGGQQMSSPIGHLWGDSNITPELKNTAYTGGVYNPESPDYVDNDISSRWGHLVDGQGVVANTNTPAGLGGFGTPSDVKPLPKVVGGPWAEDNSIGSSANWEDYGGSDAIKAIPISQDTGTLGDQYGVDTTNNSDGLNGVGNFDRSDLAGGIAQKQLEDQIAEGGSLIDPSKSYEENYKSILEHASDLGNVPQYYTDDTVADFTDTQLSGQKGAIDTGTRQDALTENLIKSYQDQLDPNSAFNQEIAKQASQSATSSFGTAGTLGSARNAVAANTASQNAIRAAQEQARSGIAAQRDALGRKASAELEIGQAQQQQLQDIINEDIKRFNYAQLTPQQQMDRILGIINQLEAVKQGQAAAAAGAGTGGSGSSDLFKNLASGFLKDKASSFLDGLFNQGGKVDYRANGGLLDTKQHRYTDVRVPSFFAKDVEKEEGTTCPEGYFYSEATNSCQPIPGYNKDDDDSSDTGVIPLHEQLYNADVAMMDQTPGSQMVPWHERWKYKDLHGFSKDYDAIEKADAAKKKIVSTLGNAIIPGLGEAIADKVVSDDQTGGIDNDIVDLAKLIDSASAIDTTADGYVPPDQQKGQPHPGGPGTSTNTTVNGVTYDDDGNNVKAGAWDQPGNHATWDDFVAAASGKTSWGGKATNNNTGGKVSYRNMGMPNESSVNGMVPHESQAGVDPMVHPGEPIGTDTVPAWLTEDEFVVDRDSTAHFQPVLEAINEWEPGQDDSAVANKIMAELEALINNKAFGDKGMPENAPKKPISAYAGGMMRRY